MRLKPSCYPPDKRTKGASIRDISRSISAGGKNAAPTKQDVGFEKRPFHREGTSNPSFSLGYGPNDTNLQSKSRITNRGEMTLAPPKTYVMVSCLRPNSWHSRRDRHRCTLRSRRAWWLPTSRRRTKRLSKRPHRLTFGRFVGTV